MDKQPTKPSSALDPTGPSTDDPQSSEASLPLTRERPPVARRAVALLLFVVIAALGALSFQRKVEQFQRLGFVGELTAGHIAVGTVSDPITGLQAGDQILLVNGAEGNDLAAVRENLLARATSQLVILRDIGLTEIVYSRPPIQVDWPYLILAVVAIGYLLIGFFTLWKEQHTAAIRFYIWCLASAAIYLFSPIGTADGLDKLIYWLDEIARLAVAPLTLHLFWRFPEPLFRSALWRRVTPFFYLPAAILVLLQTDLAFANGRYLFSGRLDVQLLATLDRIELAHFTILMLAAVGVLIARLQRTTEPAARRQATWMAVGVTAGYLPFLLLYTLPRSFDLAWPQPITIVAVLPLVLVPLTFAYAILRYRLWDIGVMVRDMASLSLTLLIGVIGFSLVNLIADRAIPSDLAVTRNLTSFITGLVLAGVMLPTRRGISASIERLQYRSQYRKRHAVKEFGAELVHERDLSRLCASLLERVRDGLEIDRLNLLLVDRDRLWVAFPQPGLTDEVAITRIPEFYWDREQAAVSRTSLADLGLTAAPPSTAEAPFEQSLYAVGYRYAFPLKVRDDRIGLLVVGYKHDEVALNSDDIDLIRNLLNQASLAFDNARLLDQVKQQLDEVSRLQLHNQQIIESSPAGIAVIGSDGAITSANAAFAAVVRRTEAELTGLDLSTALPISPLPKPGDGLMEVAFCDPEGEERHLQLSSSLLEENGERRRILVVQDVSDRVAMEHELEEKERLAALGMLAAGVAHEVNTPITGISSYAQMLLANTPEDDPRHELLKKVERQTFRAAGIVNNLLEFSRDRRPDYRAVDLVAVVEEMLDHLSERIADRAVTVDWTPPQEPLSVYGADGELLQVVTNLVGNALDAMTPQVGVLRIALSSAALSSPKSPAQDSSAASSADRVLLEIEDNGEGIPESQLDKIFQPFFSTKLAKGGTGLGLSISYNIVRRHGGEVRVSSAPGKGTHFTIELPLHRS